MDARITSCSIVTAITADILFATYVPSSAPLVNDPIRSIVSDVGGLMFIVALAVAVDLRGVPDIQ